MFSISIANWSFSSSKKLTKIILLHLQVSVDSLENRIQKVWRLADDGENVPNVHELLQKKSKIIISIFTIIISKLTIAGRVIVPPRSKYLSD